MKVFLATISYQVVVTIETDETDESKINEILLNESEHILNTSTIKPIILNKTEILI